MVWYQRNKPFIMPVSFLYIIHHNLHSEAAALLLRLLLQVVGDLGVGFEELGSAPVQADGFAFAELAFAVGLVNAF